MSHDREELRQQMLALDPIERCTTLALSIVQMHPQDIHACTNGMLQMIKAMAKQYGATKRGIIANQLRDIADEIEASLFV